MKIIEHGKSAVVEFISSKKNDIIADQFCFLLENILYDPLLECNLKRLEESNDNFKLIFKIIKKEYPDSEFTDGIIIVKKNSQHVAVVNLDQGTVDCKD
jgi:hypothetical protein